MKLDDPNAFPYQLIEIINGTLLISLLWMFVFLLIHLTRAWNILSKHWGRWTGLLRLYQANKPEIALAVFVWFFCLRTLSLWYLRFIKNNRFDGVLLIVDNDAFILIWTTAVMVIAIACWIRVISPLKGAYAVAIWAMMIFTSLAFGLGMNLAF